MLPAQHPVSPPVLWAPSVLSEAFPSVHPPRAYRTATWCLPGTRWGSRGWSLAVVPRWKKHPQSGVWARGPPSQPCSAPPYPTGDASPELGDPPPQGPTSLEPAAPLESTEEGPDTERYPGRGLGVLSAGIGAEDGCGVLLPFAPAVPKPSPLCPALSLLSSPSSFISLSSSLSFLFLFFFTIISPSSSLFPFICLCSSHSPSPPLALHPSACPSPPLLHFHPSLCSFSLSPAPCSCFLVPFPSAPPVLCAHAWGPCPPHSWGGRLCPLPVLVQPLWGPFGGWGR